MFSPDSFSYIKGKERNLKDGMALWLKLWFILLFVGTAISFVCEHHFLCVAIICTYHNEDTQHCSNAMQIHGWSQELTNLVETVGTWSMNALSAGVLITVYTWKNYSTKSFLKNIIKMSDFWSFVILYVFVSTPLITIDAYGQSHLTGIVLNNGLIIEYGISSLLALTIFYVDLEVVDRWLTRKLESERKQFYAKCFIKMVFLVCMLRNLYRSLYNTYCATIKISHVEFASLKYLDFVLQVMNVAYRVKLTKLFYSYLFKDIEPPVVCN